jgi:hypothetical protein
MRFMMLMIPGHHPAVEDLPKDAVEKMMAYNEELSKAGVLLALDGLHAPEDGARGTYAEGRPSVTDGPFAEAKELIGGYWVIQASSKEEAIEWAKRIPAGSDDIVEVRQVQDFEDFTPEVQEVAQLSQTPPAQPIER